MVLEPAAGTKADDAGGARDFAAVALKHPTQNAVGGRGFPLSLVAEAYRRTAQVSMNQHNTLALASPINSAF
jgi:hypothetical protein